MCHRISDYTHERKLATEDLACDKKAVHMYKGHCTSLHYSGTSAPICFQKSHLRPRPPSQVYASAKRN